MAKFDKLEQIKLTQFVNKIKFTKFLPCAGISNIIVSIINNIYAQYNIYTMT